jgi:hypothetical protein
MRFGFGMAACLVGLLGLDPAPAPAAWNNVFQVTCHSCRTPSVVAFAAPVCPPPPCVPTVSYVQRSFYQPVTTYKTTTYYEPVTVNQVSYYYEPVTTVRYSTYYDPCTGCPQLVACPQTSYRLRSQCNAVTSYVKRCALVPVTSYQQISYYEPVINGSPCASVPAPAISESPVVPPPAVTEQPGGSRIPPTQIPTVPPPGTEEKRMLPSIPDTNNPSGYRQPLQLPVPGKTGNPPPFRPGQIASLPGSSGQAAPSLTGLIVQRDYITPRSGVQLTFVSAGKTDLRQAALSDGSGRFSVALPPGHYYVYVDAGNGQSIYHSQLTLRANEPRNVTVVSR